MMGLLFPTTVTTSLTTNELGPNKFKTKLMLFVFSVITKNSEAEWFVIHEHLLVHKG